MFFIDNTEYDFLIDEEYDEDIDCIVVKKGKFNDIIT